MAKPATLIDPVKMTLAVTEQTRTLAHENSQRERRSISSMFRDWVEAKNKENLCTVVMNEADSKLFKRAAKLHGLSVEDYFKKSARVLATNA